MKIEQSTLEDLPLIFDLYEKATAFQKIKFPSNAWPVFDKEMVRQEIKRNQHWKLWIDNEVACVWVTAFSDPLIWEEKNIDPAVYLHRIAANPIFKGKQLMEQIVGWAKEYAIQNQKDWLRMDTCGNNEGLIAYYTSKGFDFLGVKKLKNTTGLPAHYVHADVCFFQLKINKSDDL